MDYITHNQVESKRIRHPLEGKKVTVVRQYLPLHTAVPHNVIHPKARIVTQSTPDFMQLSSLLDFPATAYLPITSSFLGPALSEPPQVSTITNVAQPLRTIDVDTYSMECPDCPSTIRLQPKTLSTHHHRSQEQNDSELAWTHTRQC